VRDVSAARLSPQPLPAGDGRAALAVHTTRAVRPFLVAIVTVIALAVLGEVVAGTRGVAIPEALLQLAAAAIAVSVATPHDPAANLVAAVPTGPARRVAYRSVVAASVAIAGWVLGGWLSDVVVASPPAEAAVGADVPALVALAALALAGGRWWVPWGACAPLAVVGAGRLVVRPDPVAEALELWSTHPWYTLAAGLIATAGHLLWHP
jgi:hypothetical protein